MIDSLSQINSLLSQIKASADELNSRLDANESGISGLLATPAKPGAMEEYENFVSERKDIAAFGRASVVTKFSELLDLFNAANSTVKNQVKNNIISLRTYLEATSQKSNNQKDVLLPKLKDAIEQAQFTNAQENENDNKDGATAENQNTNQNNETQDSTGENQSQDDGSNEGTNSAPGNSANPTNVQSPGEPTSNGQKTSKTGTTTNPLTTALRRWNPLSKFSSYTYCLSLYIVTPECMNYFAENGTLPPNNDINTGRWFIVAKSGGMNSDKDPRALTLDEDGALGPGKPGLDYMMEDLNFEMSMLGADGQKTATTATTFTFKIVEPIGFTFLTKLSKASNQVNKLTNLLGVTEETKRPNLYQQHYMIGIKFYGYGPNGELIESSKLGENTNSVLGDPYAIYERIFPIIGTKVSFKIDGRATTYNFEATLNSHQTAYGSKRGIMLSSVNVEGSTVGEIIGGLEKDNKNSLFYKLNNVQETSKTNKNINVPNIYKIDWGDFKELQNSPVITSQDADLKSSGGSSADSTRESNPDTSRQSNVVKTNSKFTQFSPNTAITSALDQIIVKSSYIADKLTKENKSRIEAETENNSPTGLINWYIINPITKVIKRDDITNDWAYEITYQIRPYQIPYIKSQYIPARTKYYGPIKQYDFSLTGQNTEVISFEMEYNNSFYVVQTPNTTPDNSAKNQGAGKVTPVQPGHSASAPTSGSTNNANVIVENVRANLYSIADQASATIKIIGDPDLIMDSIGYKISNLEGFSKFYSNVNQSISPYGGQLFIEIIFNVAEDYKENTGLLDLDPNQIIAFYPVQQQQMQGSKGIIYKINKVVNSFNRGKFEQTLDLYMVPPQELVFDNSNDSSAERAESSKFARQSRPNTTTEGARESNINKESQTKTPTTQGASTTGTASSAPLNKNSAGTPTQTGSTQQDDAYIPVRSPEEESGRG